MDDTFSKLYDEFMVYVDKNDETGAQKFLIDNFKKFPQGVQDELTFVFFEKAIKEETKGMKEVSELQKQGLDAISEIDKAKKILEDKIKIRDLRAKLTK